MKLISKATGLAALFIAGTVVVLSCSNISVNEQKQTEVKSVSKTSVLINFSNTEARTALPVIDWNDFTYELTTIKNPGEATQGDSVTQFSNKTKENLVQGFEMDIGKYRFTLNAYKDGNKVLSGVTTQDISSGNTSLTFRMMAVKGGTGAAQVKIRYPSGSPVATVKAACSSDIFASVTGETLTITDDAGEKVVRFNAESIPAGTEQYALFWFYDATGTLVYTGAESLVIVAGCTSVSEIELTSAAWHTYLSTITLKKDGAGWAGSGKTVKAVNQVDSSKVYTLKAATEGKYTASISEGDYYIYVNDVNTNIGFKSVNKNADVNYWTVNLATEKGCTFTAVSGGIDVTEKSAVVLNGTAFVYQIGLARGYKVKDGSSLVIKLNGAAIDSPVFDSDLTVNSVSAAQTISVSTLEPVVYSISYLDDSGAAISTSESTSTAYWTADYTAPASFTVETPATLPSILDVNKKGGKFDAWLDGSATGASVVSTDGVFKNLVLYASWKDFVQVDNSSSTVYANGYNLLIQENGTATEIWVDYDGDGVIDAGVDEQVKDGSVTDFTNYSLSAGSYDGKAINSDFTFTMTGGKIKSIMGLDSKTDKKQNKSTLKISGTAVIGGAESVATSTDSEGKRTTTATNVYGIQLETITNEWVNIVGAMSGSYEVYCVTPYGYEEGVERTVAYIENSTYANFKHFTCYTYDETLDDNTGNARCYIKNILGMKNVLENGIQRTKIQIRDDSGVSLPSAEEIGDVTIEFSLGDNRVTSECSVFSISCEKGTFRVNERTTITENSSDDDVGVEKTLSYMCQPTATTYEYQLAFRNSEGDYKTYVYMQVLSEGNQLTPEMASDFLKQVYFKRDNPAEAMKIKVNLETVESSTIAAAGVKYFNGSFYKYVPYSGTVSWTACYKNAKASEFNGLHGYLMNVSSEVENSYIYNFNAGKASWIGGSRNYPENGAFDKDEFTNDSSISTYSISTNVEKGGVTDTNGTTWYWQAGPEAGQPFWRGTNSTTTTAQVMDEDGNYRYTKWNNKNMNNGSSGAEPNNSGGETCIQYLTNNSPAGLWNDLGAGSSTPKAYYIEYTPYEVYWNGKEAGANSQYSSKPAITRTATY